MYKFCNRCYTVAPKGTSCCPNCKNVTWPLKAIGTWSICNTASLAVYYIDPLEDFAIVGLCGEQPHRIPIQYIDDEIGILWGVTFYSFSDCLKINF